MISLNGILFLPDTLEIKTREKVKIKRLRCRESIVYISVYHKTSFLANIWVAIVRFR